MAIGDTGPVKRPGHTEALVQALDSSDSQSPSRTNDSKPPTPIARRLKDAAASVYQKTVVEIILRRKHVQASTDGRHIPLNIELEKPLIDTRRGLNYVSNTIRTSRYTIWDFVPKQLFFQFSRVGNFYFLCVGVPQMVPHTLV